MTTRRRSACRPIRASSIDTFVYQQGGNGNDALFNVASGTAAFVASLVAKTGDMKVATDSGDARYSRHDRHCRSAGRRWYGAAPTVKLYPDADGHVGRIEVFDRQGGRLGELTQGASAFTLRTGPNGRIVAVPYRIPPQEAARDRGVLQRLNRLAQCRTPDRDPAPATRAINRRRQNNQRPNYRRTRTSNDPTISVLAGPEPAWWVRRSIGAAAGCNGRASGKSQPLPGREPTC